MTPADVSREALSWLGTRYHWQGRTRAGLDCGGLPAVVGGALGVFAATPPAPRYRPPLPTGFLVGELRQYLVERAHAKPKGCTAAAIDCCGECRSQLVGTVVALGPGAQHCGIVTDDGRLVSVSSACGCNAITFGAAVLRMTKHVFEFPGVTYGR